MIPLRRLFGWGLMLLAGSAGTAAAQTPSPLANWQLSVGQVLAPQSEPESPWRVTLGAGGLYRPRYEGSSIYRPMVGPTIDLLYADRLFLSTGEGIGVNLLRGKGYRAGVAVSYDLGRDVNIDDRLRGLGDIAPAAEAKIFGEVALLPVVLRLDVRRGLGGHDGFIADVGAYMPIPLDGDSGKKTVAFVGPTVTLADSNYMQSYFGVGVRQAARAQQLGNPLRRYDADGGLKSAGVGATVLHHFSERWFVEGQAAWSRLLGSAADSPIVTSDSQFTGGLSFGYHF